MQIMRSALALRSSLLKFRRECSDFGRLQFLIPMDVFLESLETEFNLPEVPISSSQASKPSYEQLERQIRYQKRKREQAEEQLRDNMAARMGQRIQTLWYVRTAVADPIVPAQTLSNVCKEFPITESVAGCQ